MDSKKLFRGGIRMKVTGNLLSKTLNTQKAANKTERDAGREVVK